MIINKEQFQENFKYFDKEIIVEIIDLFINEFDERMFKLKNSIDKSEMETLRFNAHSLKGVIANFVAEEPHQLAKSLEEHAMNGDTSELTNIYDNLYTATSNMVNELKDIRVIYAM